MYRKIFLLTLGISLLMLILAGFNAQTQPQITKSKETVLGKYVNAQEAYEMWKANPETIKILDVRTHGEYVFVGHAPMAFNIPYLLLTTQWNTSTKSYIMEPNPGFVSDVKRKFALQDTILVMCRSGGRSASAVNILAEEGYKNVYSIIDGFEGDVVDDSGSYFNGKRFKNGWKNSGAPWTYELNSDVVYK